MNLRSSFRPVVLLIAGLLLGGCGNYNAWHQKLIVTVETPDGVKTGSSVVLVGLHDTTGNEWMTLPQARGARYELTGEAVVLELAPGRYLFTLLKGLPYATNVFFPDEPPVETAPALADMRASRELSPKQYPLLVTFADINDPASVTRVDPDDLAAIFGPGYALSSITLEITDEPVTKGRVEAVLGWLGDIKGRIKPTDKKYADELDVEETLYSIDFVRGS
ncbi:hypothetical protein [uncultured Hoeflea sp.]|uniref:hypothetical protein n=1 Tax=uncultured Hoeflea sp. TaxID=538666 RepID=UPI00262C19EB|nr:hypothetical protein [uncultured Hoeflea sp.]